MRMPNTPIYYIIDDQVSALDVMHGAMSGEEYRGFLKGNCIKYAVRMGRKGNDSDAISDAHKLANYANLYAAAVADDD